MPSPQPSSRARGRWIAVAIGIVVAAGIGTLAAVLASSGGDEVTTNGTSQPPIEGPSPLYPLTSVDPSPPPAPTLQVPQGGTYPDALTYVVSGDYPEWHVMRLDLKTGTNTTLFTADSGIAMSRGGSTIAYYSYRLKNGHVQKNKPSKGSYTRLLTVRDLDTGRNVVLGEAGSPHLSWDGTKIAVIAGSQQVWGADLTEKHPKLHALTQPGEWQIFGWAGDRVLAFLKPPFRNYLISLQAQVTEVATPNAIMWQPSPDGKWVFAIGHQGQAVFQPLAGGDPTIIDLGGWQIGKVYWTLDDRLFAPAATGQEVTAPATLLEMDPATGGLLEVPHTEDMVDVMPAMRGGSFALARGHFPPTWTISDCLPAGRCHESGKVKIGASFAQLR
ncbi:MAG: hypothetical protein ABR600_10110 [Actinomycetota bacterium]